MLKELAGSLHVKILLLFMALLFHNNIDCPFEFFIDELSEFLCRKTTLSQNI